MYFDRNIDLSEKISMAKKKCGQLFVVLHSPMDSTLTKKWPIQNPINMVTLMYGDELD